MPSDYVAPGYSKLIARPVAFSTIRARAAAGGYRRDPPERGWDELCDDLDTMLDNCRAYNGPDSPWGLYADAFQLAAARMLQLSRAGEDYFFLFFFFWFALIGEGATKGREKKNNNSLRLFQQKNQNMKP